MRRIGGNIGPIVTPGASAINSTAGGVWTLLEVEYFKRTGIWPTSPTVPGAPTSLAASGGSAQLSLTWTAPANTGGIPITGYVVEFTPSGGSASTVNTGSAASSYSLTGLTNGTTYTVRVAAVNAIDQGAYSGTATGTPVAGPLLVYDTWIGGNGNLSASGLGSAASPLRLLNQNDWDTNTLMRFTPTASGTLTITGRGYPVSWNLWRTGTPNTYILSGSGGTVVTRTASVLSGVQYEINVNYGGFDVSMYLT